jgi:hypothetical protein
MAVLATWLINGVLFPSAIVPSRQVVGTGIVVAVVAFAVAWREQAPSMTTGRSGAPRQIDCWRAAEGSMPRHACRW